MSSTQPKAHRGRVQAQGGKPAIEESEAWAQDSPLTLPDGHAKLADLYAKLPPGEQQSRTVGFALAREYMVRASLVGGTGPVKRSFPHGLRRNDPRVDVEVQKGLAFIPVPVVI